MNGARLWIRIGGYQMQPGEFVKLLLVISLAGYLRENREVLTYARRRVLGVDIPAPATWARSRCGGVSLGVLAVMNDLGSALLLFGIFLAMIYVATGRQLYTVPASAFVAGSWLVYKAVAARARALRDLDRSLGDAADDRLPGRAVARLDRRRRHLRHGPRPQPALIGHGQTIIPAAQTDCIYAPDRTRPASPARPGCC